jgi:hypothetical protein
MCGSGPTSTSSTSAEMNDAQKAAMRSAGRYERTWGHDQPIETGAYGGIKENSSWAESMMPYQQQLIQQLYGGGGLGEGMPWIRDAYEQQNQTWQPYLQGNYLDPMSNPYLQPAIESARSGAMNSVADRFHKAGRSFSGSEGAAYGDAVTKAALPMLLGQYNQNVGAQQNAAQGVLAGALGSATGMDTAQSGILKAKMAAPGQISSLNIPENMLLGIADRQRKAAYDAAALRASAAGGMAGSSTTTSSTSQDPFQTLLGGGLGLLGMFL